MFIRLPLVLLLLVLLMMVEAQQTACPQFFPSGAPPPQLLNPKLAQRTTLLCNDASASLAWGFGRRASDPGVAAWQPIGKLKIENSTNQLSLYGSLDITRDISTGWCRRGSPCWYGGARGQTDLPQALPKEGAPKTVRNPSS